MFFADAHVPAGYAAINVAPGKMNLAAVPTASSVAGQFAFVLPKGGKWSIAGRTPAPGQAQVVVPLPSTLTAPLLVTGVTAGQGFLLSWTDSSGAAQATAYLFA
jgi:hypothetical protein